MGKQFDRQDSEIEFQRNLPGCMWSMFHVLDYHHWHSKISPRRRHRRGKHTICCGYPKTISFPHYTDEEQNFLDVDAVPSQHGVEAAASKRNSGKARIKALIAKEISTRSQLQRDISINGFRQSKDVSKKTADWRNPIIILERNGDNAASRLHVSSQLKESDAFSSEMGDKLVSKSLNHNFSDSKQISHSQFVECGEVVEIFKAENKLFVEILHDPDVQASKKLKKSGSFPLAVSPHKIFKPVTLEHKWKETWSFRKGEKSPNVVGSKFDMLSGLKDDDDGGGVAGVTHESDLYSSSTSKLPHGSNKHGWHQSFMRHLKDAIKKITHIGSEKKDHMSMNAFFHRIPSISNDKNENSSEKLKDIEANNSYNDFVKKVELPHMRRISSLNESMDRYTRLFEYSSNKEAGWHKYQSKSLRLANEDKFPTRGSSQKSVRRRLSLPDLESLCPFPNETSIDAFQSGTPIKTSTKYDMSSENVTWNELNSRIEQLDGVEEAVEENTEEAGNSCEIKEYSDDLIVCQDQNISPVINSSIVHENESPVSVLETHFRHDITSQAEFPFSKDSELDSKGICIDEPDSSVNLQEASISNSWSDSNLENTQNTQTKPNNSFLPLVDDADFNYVRDILELSGFTEQECLGMWHSLDHPLSPTLFKELEAYLHQEVECSPEDVASTNNHQLLFDLSNEFLLQIYESSLAYYPKPFSFARRVRLRPSPKGDHIVEEVWRRISSFRNPNSKLDQTLDDIVARDLAKDESWINLQLDVEDIALDLEDLIFDQLLDEIICS
ncbi:protein TRM32-like [Mercurialis annua]|uniref:protein TRM32-like n=1 Tax=Mercurialis annua TaxID=3986 RepID=UPI00215EDDC5|nr:protein TRM32-like [Mercurialis annua]XP_050213973.1 protein TRM32-like [Mercurialis annua]